mgnify:CR=1 FL=1
MGKVLAVCISEKKGTQKKNVGSAVFVEDWGLEGDAHAGKWHRQVSLLSGEKIDAFRAKGAEVEDGAFGENLVVEGIDFAKLPVGIRFRCGEVVLELTQIGKECHNGCAIFQKMGECIMPREGVFTRVLKGGKVSVGDEMTVDKAMIFDTHAHYDDKMFNEDRLNELAESIKQHGIVEPLIVVKKDDYYEIVAGERRFRAAMIAGLTEVPVVIKDYSTEQIVEIALIENIQREDLNPIEEAKAYQQLIDEFSLKQDEVADKVSKSRTAITNALRLLKLDERVQNMVIEECISSGHARTLLAIENKEEQYDIACMVFDQKLSVRETEKLIKKLNNKGTPKKKAELYNKEIYADFEEKLKQSMGTKVSINRKNNTKGKIEIEYYSETELERIIGIMLKNS